MNREFYVVKPEENFEIPIFFEAQWQPQLPDINQAETNPVKSQFDSNYYVSIDLNQFKIDAVLEQYIVSSKFAELCSALKCDFIEIPLSISLASGELLSGFRFFCILSRCSLLDVKKSNFVLTDQRLLRPSADRVDQCPVYDRIDKFVVKHDIEEDFFYCEELKQIVCSSVFREAYVSKNFKGLNFLKIDSKFVYAPWDGW